MTKVLKRRYIVYSTIVLLVAILGIGANINVNVDNPFKHERSMIGNFITITIGTDQVYAAGTPDYTCDGVDDNVQFAAALNALPATGGEIEVLGGTYVWANATSVTRAIDNVTITGVGRGSYFSGDGVTALWICGGNNWKFQDIRTDAGSITTGVTTGWQMINVDLNGTLYSYADPSNSIVGGLMTVTALTTGGKLTAGANEIEGSNFDINGGAIDGATLGAAAQVTISDADINAGTMDGVDATFGAGTTLSTVGGTVTSDTTDDVGESKKLGHARVYAFDSADYTVTASDTTNGIWKCNNDGDDQPEIAAALTAISTGGVVELIGLNFTLQQDLTNNKGLLLGQGSSVMLGDYTTEEPYRGDPTGGTIITLDTNDATYIQTGAGLTANIDIWCDRAWNDIAVDVQADAEAELQTGTQHVLYNVSINYDERDGAVTQHVGTGLRIYVDGTAHTSGIQDSTFNNVTVWGFDKGLHLYADDGGGANQGYINGNDFTNLRLIRNNDNLYLETANDGTINGNYFQMDNVEGALVGCTGITWVGDDINWNRYDIMWWNFDSDDTRLELSGFTGTDFTDTIIQQGLDPNTAAFFRSELTYDQNASGIITMGVCGDATGFVTGDVVYQASDNDWELADASAVATGSPNLAMVASKYAIAQNEWAELLLEGYVKETDWPLNGATVGDKIYLSTTAGDWDDDPPTGDGEILRMLGAYCDTDVVYFDPDEDWFELNGAGGIDAIDGVAIGGILTLPVSPRDTAQTPNLNGWDTDGAGEGGMVWFVAPEGITAITKFEFWGVSNVAEVDAMSANFYYYAAASNEAYNTHTDNEVDEGSVTTNFAGDDVIYWELDSGEISMANVSEGDMVTLMLTYDAGAGDDCATDVDISCVKVYYAM